MTLLNVLKAPDPFLKKIAKPVDIFDTKLMTLIDDMFETMYENSGIGLAATQVNHDKRLIVIDIDHDSEVGEESKNPLVLINPVITEKEGERVMEEGCLSVPEFRAEINRAASIKLNFIDQNQNQIELEALDLLSICIQHELDHLNGILFIDYLPVLKRKILLKKLKKLKNQD